VSLQFLGGWLLRGLKFEIKLVNQLNLMA